MKLRLINKGDFDYLDVGVTFPDFDFSTKDTTIEGRMVTRRVTLETCIYYRSEDFFTYFTIRILGFGFYIARQTGY